MFNELFVGKEGNDVEDEKSLYEEDTCDCPSCTMRRKLFGRGSVKPPQDILDAMGLGSLGKGSGDESLAAVIKALGALSELRDQMSKEEPSLPQIVYYVDERIPLRELGDPRFSTIEIPSGIYLALVNPEELENLKSLTPPGGNLRPFHLWDDFIGPFIEYTKEKQNE